MTTETQASGSLTRSAAAGLMRRRPLQFSAPSLTAIWTFGDDLERRCARAQRPTTVYADAIASCYRAMTVGAKAASPSIEGLPPRQLRWVPLALFYPPDDPTKWLATNRSLLEELFSWIERTRNARAVVRLLRAYVMFYSPELSTFELLRDRLRGFIGRLQSPRILERRAWADDLGILADDAPRVFTAGWPNTPTTLLDRLSRLGRDGELALSLFARAVENTACEDLLRLATAMTESQFTAVANALSRSDDDGRRRFRDSNIGVRLANGVLLTFAERRPAEQLRLAIRKALVERWGDPRVSGNQLQWEPVAPRARQVFRRWLVDDTLRVFFDLISAASQSDPDAKARWESRRQFWSAYLDDISDAWVALSPAAARMARQDPAFEEIPHGLMERDSVGNSVLIMAIDDLLIVDFSHVGGVRYWPGQGHRDDDARGPELFRAAYRIADFQVNAGTNIPHHERWQSRVKAVIRNHTGVQGRA